MTGAVDGTNRRSSVSGTLAYMEKEPGDLQSPLTHEGAEPDDHDSNENADDKVEILQPDGSEAPRAGES